MSTILETIQAAYATAQSGRPTQAIDDLRRSLRLHADNADLHHHLGILFLQMGQRDSGMFHLERAALHGPDNPEIQSNFATALNMMGRSADAVNAFKAAIKARETWFPAQLGLASALIGTNNFKDAAAASRRATELSPQRAEAWINLSIALHRSGRGAECMKALRDGLAHVPGNPLLLVMLANVALASPEAATPEVYDIHRQAGAALTAAAGSAFAPILADVNPDRPLRIGYLAHDLRDRSLAPLILPILAAHDRAGFQPVVYSAAPLSDAVIAELHAAGTTGIDASALGDAGLDQRIRGDRIDILIDLSGHTPGSRLWAMARRPAPVQVSYLGYPCTTGLKSIGHRIVDAITDPEGGDDLSTEKLVRLEGCAACYQPPEGEISPPPADRTGHISFASFSPVPRISEQMAELWSRILKAVPGSELTIAAPGADSLWTQEHFREVFGRHGVEGQRLRFQSPGTGWNAAAYHDVDIALDTSPWNGLTSTCDALWMGVPVVSLAADRAAGRVGRSLLTACGQPDLVVSTAGAYVDLAVALAQDSPRRAGLRRSLRETMKRSPILDGAGVTRRLEAVYRSLWRDWCGKVYYTE